MSLMRRKREVEITRERVNYLKRKAKEMRKKIVTMIYEAQSGHPGGSLSAVELVTVLYFDQMRVNPNNPKSENRDRFILSKGHACPVLYTALAMKGFFPLEELSTLRKFHSRLQGHPDMNKTPGVDMSSGSLGQGFSCAVGMAIAAKRDNRGLYVYVLVGDGECNEGQIWEAAQTAVKYRLDNLIVIVDNNNLQNDGPCEEIMPLLSLKDKFSAFGFYTVEIDGHNIEEIITTFEELKKIHGKPKCIIAKTVKGKGVSFMENVVEWHGKAPNEQQYEQAIKEIEGA